MKIEHKIILSKYFLDENNKDSLLKIFNQESYEYFLKENFENNKINIKEDESEDKIENKEHIMENEEQ